MNKIFSSNHIDFNKQEIERSESGFIYAVVLLQLRLWLGTTCYTVEATLWRTTVDFTTLCDKISKISYLGL